MRTIKFRGVDIITGDFVYGGYVDGFIVQDDHCYTVKPNSIAQLVGTDKSRHDVYEGDLLYNPARGNTFKAAMNHIYIVGNCILVKAT